MRPLCLFKHGIARMPADPYGMRNVKRWLCRDACSALRLLQITEDTYMALPEEERGQWSCRGHVEVKGKVRPPACHVPPDTCLVTCAVCAAAGRADHYALSLIHGT